MFLKKHSATGNSVFKNILIAYNTKIFIKK